MKKISILLALLVCIAGNAMAQARVGDKAPEIKIGEWLQPETAVDFSGKLVLLDFWATWCRPCVASIPKLNEEVGKYGDKIRFISITNETSDRVKPFLAQKSMKSSVVCDDKNTTFKTYGVASIPTVFLIDGSGTIIWRGHPGYMSDEMLEAFIKGEKDVEKYSRNPQAPSPSVEQKASQKEYSFKIASNRTKIASSSNINPNQIMIQNMRVRDILANIMGISVSRIVGKNTILDNFYDVTAVNDGKSLDDFKKQVLGNITDHFKIKLETDERKVDAYSLKIKDDAKLQKSISTNNVTTSSMTKGDYLLITNMTLTEIARELESHLDLPVFLDDKDDQKRYNLALEVQSKDKLASMLKDNVGIELKKEKQKTQVYVVN